MTERLHPESIKTLRQLVLLHGAARIIAAVREIEQQDKQPPDIFGKLPKP